MILRMYWMIWTSGTVVAERPRRSPTLYPKVNYEHGLGTKRLGASGRNSRGAAGLRTERQTSQAL